MAINAEQREARRKYLGSSDAAAVLGLDRYRTPHDVWLSKTGRVDDGPSNDAMEAGTLLEPIVVQWAVRALALGPYFCDVMRLHPKGVLCANLDAQGVDPDGRRGVVEAKTTGIVGPPDPAYGEVTEGEFVELPERVIVQVAHQLAVCPDLEVAWVPVLIGRIGFRLYTIERSPELVEAIEEQEFRWWERHIIKDAPPSDSLPSLDVLKRLRRVPQKTVPVPDEIADAFIAARAAKLQAEKDCKDAERELLAALGDADGGEYSGGMFTYFEQKRKAYEVAECSYRTLRVKAKQTAAMAGEAAA